jgi:hypothetical protein
MVKMLLVITSLGMGALGPSENPGKITIAVPEGQQCWQLASQISAFSPGRMAAYCVPAAQ